MTRKLLPLLLLALSAPAWGYTWAYYAKITVPHAQVSGSSDLSNFTVTVELSDASFKSSGAGGQINHTVAFNGQTVPADLVFTTDSTCATYGMNWDIESYDGTNGIVWAHVLIPTLSHTVDTVFYACYGSTPTTYLGGAIGSAYDTYVAGQWNLATNTAVSLVDSSTNGNNLTVSSGGYTNLVLATGVFDGAGTGGYYHSLYTSASPPGLAMNTQHVTIRMWLNVSTNNQPRDIAWKASNYWDFGINGSGKVYCDFYGGGIRSVVGSTTLSISTWYHVACVLRTTGLYVYVNGIPDGSSLGSWTPDTNSDALNIGDAGNTSNYTIDNVGVASLDRSPDWLVTEANNGTVASFAMVSAIGACCSAASTAVTMTPIIM